MSTAAGHDLQPWPPLRTPVLLIPLGACLRHGGSIARRRARGHGATWHSRVRQTALSVAPPALHHLGVLRIVPGAEGEVLDTLRTCLHIPHGVLVESDRVPLAE